MAELWDVLDMHRNKTGRLHERKQPMGRGDGHLIVHVWIVNGKGEFFISRRLPGPGRWCGMWHTTGGCAVAGDDGLSAALRETKEELGLELSPENGLLYKQFSEPHINDEGTALIDVWLFRQEVDISTVVCQPDEICDAKWASKEQIRQMIADGTFIPQEEAYGYLEELFRFCDCLSFWQALDRLVEEHEFIIDRPKGSAHPRYTDFVYPLNYGYLQGTAYSDGSGIDVWQGSAGTGVVAVMTIVDLMRRDSEIKILLGCTEDEIKIVNRVHNETEFMKGILIRRDEA